MMVEPFYASQPLHQAPNQREQCFQTVEDNLKYTTDITWFGWQLSSKQQSKLYIQSSQECVGLGIPNQGSELNLQSCLFCHCRFVCERSTLLHCPRLAVLCLSLGCGIGYGYLHRIPTQLAQLNPQNKNALQPEVADRAEEVAPLNFTEVPSVAQFSQSNDSGLDQTGGVGQSMTSDLDFSVPAEAVGSDVSDVVSTNEEGHSSVFANYRDDTGDQCSLDQRPSSPEREDKPDIQQTDQGSGLDVTSSTSPTSGAADDSADLTASTESATIIPQGQEPYSKPSICHISAQDHIVSDI